MQGLKKFTSHAPFLRKLLENVLHKNKGIIKKEEIMDTGHKSANTGETLKGSQDCNEGRSQDDRSARQANQPRFEQVRRLQRDFFG